VVARRPRPGGGHDRSGRPFLPLVIEFGIAPPSRKASPRV
jgi:hypothetical protein